MAKNDRARLTQLVMERRIHHNRIRTLWALHRDCVIPAKRAFSRALFADPTNLIILAGMIPLILGVLALAIFFNYRNANKLENAVISSASGAVLFDEDISSTSAITSYYVFVGKKRFTFGDEMSATFKEGEKYKFYYCKAGLYEFVMSYELAN